MKLATSTNIMDADCNRPYQMPDGKEKEIYAGEVSVRGVYGYV